MWALVPKSELQQILRIFCFVFAIAGIVICYKRPRLISEFKRITQGAALAFSIALIGITSNFLVILMNGGKMPIILLEVMLDDTDLLNEVVLTDKVTLGFLGDIFPFIFGNFVIILSIGDLFLVTAAIVMIYLYFLEKRFYKNSRL